VTWWRPRSTLERLARFAIVATLLVLACAPASINILIIGLTHSGLAGDRHDALARRLRFYARVWSATSPWFAAVIAAELIGSLALIMFGVDRLDRRARRGAPEARPDEEQP
jgi:hypothetical protein